MDHSAFVMPSDTVILDWLDSHKLEDYGVQIFRHGDGRPRVLLREDDAGVTWRHMSWRDAVIHAMSVEEKHTATATQGGEVPGYVDSLLSGVFNSDAPGRGRER